MKEELSDPEEGPADDAADAPSKNATTPSASPPSPLWRNAVTPARWARSTRLIVACLGFFVVAALAASQVALGPLTRGFVLGGPTLVAAVVWMRRMRLSWATIVVIAASLVLYGFYVGYTGLGERNFDGPEQWSYVEHVATTGTLPDKDTCFVCHHPPAYYVMAAGVYRGAAALGVAKIAKVVQGLSIAFSFAFVMFGVLIVRRFTERPRLVTLAAALLAFWPYTVLQASRVHNDVLLASAAAGSLHFLVRWCQDDRRRDLGLAVALALLATVTKLNGLVVVATVGLVAAVKVGRAPDRRAALRRVAPWVLAMSTLASAFFVLRGSGSGSGVGERTLGTAYEVRVKDYVGNEPIHYVYFDLETYLHEPYVMARLDGSGRQYFWNHLLTSSLLSTHNLQPDLETSYRFNRRIASVMSFILLGLVVLVLVALVRRRSAPRFGVLPLGIFAALTLGAHIAFRVAVPFAHHNDFRFSYPVLIPFVLAVVLGLEQLNTQRPRLARLGRAAAWLFVASSALYFVPKYRFVLDHWPRKTVAIRDTDLHERLFRGASWENERNHVIWGDEILAVGLTHPKTLNRLEIGLDAGNLYRLEVIGKDETRILELEQPADPKKGIKGNWIHHETFEPPLAAVHTIRIVPVSGDRAFAVGHMRFNGDAAPTKKPRPKKPRPKKPRPKKPRPKKPRPKKKAPPGR